MLYLVIHVSASLLMLDAIHAPLLLVWWSAAPLLAAVLTAEIYFSLLKNEGSALAQAPLPPQKYKKRNHMAE
ncbi:hypothetical protein D3OALGB2SA_3169 [Olavius algarvensis associated proteobacterium Delta 3]|nr:hypothetical protein D3OALGB2SA_3169 [Olavius algarvensis associated proteobacterium Delta 3]